MGGRRWGPYIGMIIVQLAYGVSNRVIKIALDKGLHQLVFNTYRHAIPMLLLAPFAYCLEFRNRKPHPHVHHPPSNSLSISLLLHIFVLSTLGPTISLNLFFAGLHYVSPTVASAMLNVVPTFTFLIAFFLRYIYILNY